MARLGAVGLALVLGACAPAAVGKRALVSAQAPKAIGPYSQGIEVSAGRLVFLSGQVGRDPATGKLVEGDITAQTERVMQNLQAALEAGGMTFADVVKTTVFLTDMGSFAKMNETYARYFKENPPARSTVQVSALPTPGAVLEMDAIAVR